MVEGSLEENSPDENGQGKCRSSSEQQIVQPRSKRHSKTKVAKHYDVTVRRITLYKLNFSCLSFRVNIETMWS